ncbi:hypothetical protein [Phytohabitans rumicis]|uniref:Uncharacterized protein n=2 Tax=Phytohabitans rumicis TaxID=1076125 RepID=A0A6V8LCX4_9ACTN|nr:hypothetical protein [Phytohabitans rumicis]GFJ93510.1 hypothetical protein Prum_071520 [Phytohabitans rumicis]
MPRRALQNVGLSLLIIGALVPLVATGILGLATVVFIHELAEVIVIANAVRAARTVRLPATGTPEPATTTPAILRAGRPALTLHAVTPRSVDDDCGCEPGCACCQPATSASGTNRQSEASH